MLYDLAVRGGTVVTATESFRADVAVAREKIAAIASSLRGEREIDASGKLVLPGAVDPHVHLEMALGSLVTSDDWKSGTAAALFGGTTTVIDFVEPQPGEPLLEALKSRSAAAEAKTLVDFALHMTLGGGDPETLAQIPAVVEAGCPSFKTYLTYADLLLDDRAFLSALEHVKNAGGLALVHAESQAIIEYMQDRLLKQGMIQARYHPRSRPAIAEIEAINRAAALAETAGAALYVVHVSTSCGCEAIRQARRRGARLYAETCPQYLLLTEEEYEREGFEAAKFVCSPPLRGKGDANRLWTALADGDIDCVSTDHCAWLFDGQKTSGSSCFTDTCRSAGDREPPGVAAHLWGPMRSCIPQSLGGSLFNCTCEDFRPVSEEGGSGRWLGRGHRDL